jgi:RNA polymerase sigma-B factor
MTTGPEPEDVLEVFRQARRTTGRNRRAIEDELVLSHLGIARTAARAYAGAGRDPEDLWQVACLGLTKAVQRFDPDRGTSFHGYAIPTVHGELKRYLRDVTWMIRPPRQLQDLRAAVLRSQPVLAQALGREPGLEEIAEALGEDRGAVAEALTCLNSLRPQSLEAPPEDGTFALAEKLSWVEDRQDRREERLMLRAAVRELSALEQQLLFDRYFQELTQQQIGLRLGMSQMQVCRMISRTLVKLQGRLLEDSTAADSSRRAS